MTVYLDANIVIYLVEADPNWLPRVQARLSASRLAGDQLAISDVHRLECLVGPLILGDAPILAAYTAFLSDPAILVLPVAAAAFARAAQIRATHGFKPLDSLHLAAALEHGSGRFLTNDAGLSRFPDLAVEVLT